MLTDELPFRGFINTGNFVISEEFKISGVLKPFCSKKAEVKILFSQMSMTFSEETNTTESVSFSIYYLFLDNVDNSVSIVGTINLISKNFITFINSSI